jgi:hypothetical protein
MIVPSDSQRDTIARKEQTMVFEELDSRWERALKRAVIRGVPPRQYFTGGNAGQIVRRYWMDSGTREGLRHSVRVVVDRQRVDVSCSCASSLRDGYCWHTASVLMAEGWTDEPAPETRSDRITDPAFRRESLAMLNGEDVA